MKKPKTNERRFFELFLIVITLCMGYLAYRMGSYKVVVLNLFYLQVVLAAYYLGRNAAGLLALFCALVITAVTSLDATGMAAFSSPLMIGLVLAVWAGVLGLTAILVGTLCDERAARVEELHAAYTGVVEVLSTYLQSGDSRAQSPGTRIAELSEQVATEMGLPRSRIDDIRVGALLHDLSHLDFTIQILNRAIDTLGSRRATAREHTFPGSDLAQSLGSVLRGAVPLLLARSDPVDEIVGSVPREIPLGASILQAVRAYDAMINPSDGGAKRSPREAVLELRSDALVHHDEQVVNALARIVDRPSVTPRRTPALV